MRQRLYSFVAITVMICIALSSVVICFAQNVIDITSGISLTGWYNTGVAGELTYTCMSFPNGTLPSDIGYGIIDSDQYKYFQDYIQINGKTVREINTETNVSGYKFSTFPSSAAATYRVPVIIFKNGNNLEIKIHDNYIASLGSEKIVITVKSGLYYVNAGTRYQTGVDVVFTLEDGAWSKEINLDIKDISEDISLDGWIATGNAKELTYTCMNFGNGVLPSGIEYGVIDHDQYKYYQDYITINGKTLKEINTQTDTSGYTFSTFPSSAADLYKIPVMVFQNGNNLEIKVHNNYLATLDGAVTITVLKGFYIESGTTRYEVGKNVEFIWTGSNWDKGTPAVDITAQTEINGWDVTGNSGELTYTRILFGNGILPSDIGYGIIDLDKYKYFQDYIAINGRTVREINAETDVSGYTFSTFPSSADDKYKLPVIVFKNGDNLEVKVHNKYLSSLGNVNIVISILPGLTIVNGGKRYTVSQNVSHTAFTYTPPLNITDKISINGWMDTGNAGELKYTCISFENGILPTDIGYGIIDSDKYKYLQDYITINGKTIKTINGSTNTKSYTFSTFPSSVNDIYKLPVIVYQNGNTLEVKIHKEYLKTLGNNGYTIGVLSGFSLKNGDNVYCTKSDISEKVGETEKIQNKDITDSVSINTWRVSGDSGELTYTYLNFDSGVLPEKLYYKAIDSEGYKYIQDYIAINGKTVRQINRETNTSGYVFATFPSTTMDAFKIPVVLYANGDSIEIRIHKNYLKTLSKGEITVSVLEGLSFTNKNVVSKISKTLTFTNLGGIWKGSGKEVDVTDAINVHGWVADGKTTYTTFIEFGEHKIFSGNVTDGYDLGKSLVDAITLNGKTVREINEKTNISSYEWDTFPSNTINTYKVPVILFADTSNNTIKVKIHTKYLESLKEIRIGINSNFVIENKTGTGTVYYLVSSPVDFLKTDDVWSNTQKKYTVTYMLNGKQYGELEKLKFNTKIKLRQAPAIDQGYEFSGWDYSSETGIISDVVINGYVTPVRYTVTYHLSGGTNNPRNPLFYYVTDKELTLETPTKQDGEFDGWYSTPDFETKVQKLSAAKGGNIQLYAKFNSIKPTVSHKLSTMLDGWISYVFLAVMVVAAGALFIIGCKKNRRNHNKKGIDA